MTRANEVSVTACPNGPLIVRGEMELYNENGEVLPRSRKTVALCRCGASAIRPYCDGSHTIVGFRTERPPTSPAVEFD